MTNSMNLVLENKDSFVENFLVPINKINNRAIIKINNGVLSTLTATADGSVILYGTYSITDNSVQNTINIASCDKLIKLVKHIPVKEVKFEINNNNIKYSTSKMRFTYYLLDDGILSIPPVNIEKIKSIKFDTSFTLTSSALSELIKISSYGTDDVNKVYFCTNEGGVYGEFTDKKRSNIDSIDIKLTDSFTGLPIAKSLPLNVETIRIISTNKCDKINIKINIELNVFLFELETENSKLIYIASGLQG